MIPEDYIGIERWKKIDGSIYEISSKGRLKNGKNGKMRKCKPFKNNGEVWSVKTNIRINNTLTYVNIHRLVIDHFGPPKPPHNSITVDHIDGNPTNNEILNLRWATKQMQALNRKSTLPRLNRNKLTMDDLDNISTRVRSGETFQNLSIEYGIPPSAISICIRYMHPD